VKPQRFLAAAGFGSRRACEKLILAGRVTVNGNLMTFNMDIGPEDCVQVDGKPVIANDEAVYIALNKPAGYISDRGIPHEKSALDLVQVPQRLFAVGRLDKDATGLLLLTNDGEIAFKLTHPSYEHEKEYRILVEGRPLERELQQWRTGLLLNGVMTAPARITIDHEDQTSGILDETWLCVVLHEGRKRQIKRVSKLLGHPVKQLERVRIGNILLGNLKPGEWRRLSIGETSGFNTVKQHSH
jgi:23S rRNA pseudouridine2605 synthase